MVKLTISMLIILTTALTGCITQPPVSKPSLTQAQLNTSLGETETRLSQKIEQQCAGWQKQQRQLQHLSTMQQSQQQLNNKLDNIQKKLDAKPASVAAPKAPTVIQCPATPASPIGNKIIVGEVEWLWIEAVNRVYEARVDTGATTSSMSALDITPFEKDGKSWVRFRLSPDDGDDSFEVEAPLVRYAKIRQASAETIDKRPVVALTVRLGKMTEVAEFTLNDRTSMTYPILLGREFLKDVAVVDVAKENAQPKPEIVTTQPQVKAISKKLKNNNK